MSYTVAAVDCGTNSIRLLVLRRADSGEVEELTRLVRLARLGQGVDATHEFHPDALQRTFVILDEFAGIISDLGVDRTRFVATSATRDVTNRQLLADAVREKLGTDLDVISGDEEAHLSAAGVLSGVSSPRPTLIFDIGGGSTELVVVGEDDQVASSISLNIGAVRINERFLPTDPPTRVEVAAARSFIADQLDGAGVDFSAMASAIGVAGTVTSVAADHLGLTEYSREAVHRTILSRETIREANLRWLGMPAADIADGSLMPPLRASVIGAGSTILDEIAQRVPSGEVIVSETDILDGIVHQLLAQS
ncbi:Ppx/GppA phosphatase family protein [Tessaracoccus palaemonis]|uniref:Exopolyphosphatase n=1 Tax=Tessaracoccus palaemonis TaxID=2829499 RepID=A0ABX8SJC4_9ACTN|nr:exopolyphosphatase [Tessaracoccus palaemonis]QXT63466.1 exopolyphosphatase [Tessaracoccus palaemonis]